MITLSAASAHAIPLPDGAVHCVVTSPPYYSLRKYAGQQEIEWPAVSYAPMPGLEPVEIVGCDPDCEHEWGDGPIKRNRWGLDKNASDKQMSNRGNAWEVKQGNYCQRCGGWRGALGLEPTPEAYIAHLVLCFREVRRVLRDDGCCWVVMGDSYVSHKVRDHANHEASTGKDQLPAFVASREAVDLRGKGGFKSGDLMLIPHRLALALQGDGWTCRNDVVWAKKAPMPESVAGWRWERCRVKVKDSERAEGIYNAAAYGDTPQGAAKDGGIDGTATWQPCPGCPKCSPNDGYVLRRGSWRHTRAHEYVFQLVKSMGYFCDQEKVREGFRPGSWNAMKDGHSNTPGWSGNPNVHGEKGHPLPGNPAGRNPRSVLTPRPESYPGAHYAVFPSTLIAPLIRASCPTRCCPVCGAAWAPVVERPNMSERPLRAEAKSLGERPHVGWNDYPQSAGQAWQAWRNENPDKVLGYRPTCSHDADAIPGTCLDPFVGSGTVLAVARELGLNAIGLDLSPSYLDEHAKVRVGRTPSRALDSLPLFQEVKA